MKKDLKKSLDSYLEKYAISSKDPDLLTSTVLDPLSKTLSFIDSKKEQNCVYKTVAENINNSVYFTEETNAISDSQRATQERQPRLELTMDINDALFGTTRPKTSRNRTLDEIKNSLLSHSNNNSLASYYSLEKNKKESTRLLQALDLFLITPASSVPSERLFSHAGFQVSDRRNKLLSNTTEDVMIIYENMYISHLDDDIDN